MLALYETPAGFAVFKIFDENVLNKVTNLYADLDKDKAGKIIKLQHFQKFGDTTEALSATTATIEGILCKPLKKVLKKFVVEGVTNKLLVADPKLGSAIKAKYKFDCISNDNVREVMRCIRSHSDNLLVSFPKKEMDAMALGLAHSLSRYKVKFSPDKIDTMIIQAQGLLDDLDKEINNYIMRAREWYGWHFPELSKIITDNISFIKTINLVGARENMMSIDLSDILPEHVEEEAKQAAETSMGTEISEDDIINIQLLCVEILAISEYRDSLIVYLKGRMIAMAPNLTVMVGETIGARLIGRTGSLINLAKQAASTIQILGAEKALFRALKTKKQTPKYGLIYHASYVGQASTRNKGKMSRSLAAKVALATRVDAFGEDLQCELGAVHRAKLEARLQFLEQGNLRKLSGTGKARAKFEKYHVTSEIKPYPMEADSNLPSTSKKRKLEVKKPLIEEIEANINEGASKSDEPPTKKKKKKADEASTITEEIAKPTIEKRKEDDGGASGSGVTIKKKKKTHAEEIPKIEEMAVGESKKKKKKRIHEASTITEEIAEPKIEKRKEDDGGASGSGVTIKKKKKSHTEEISIKEDESINEVDKTKKKKKKEKHEKNIMQAIEIQETIQQEEDAVEKKKKKKKKDKM